MNRGEVGKSRGWAKLALFGCLAWMALEQLGQRYQLTLVIGDSMHPTIPSGRLLIVDRRAYDAEDPARDDIVVVRQRREQLVKRVVGLPGEEVEIRTGHLFVNGVARSETHPMTPGDLDIEKGSLGPGKFAVVGDNRSAPAERLIHGVFAREEIIGRVMYGGSPGKPGD